MSWLMFNIISVLMITTVGALFYKISESIRSILLGMLYAIFIDVLLFIVGNSYYGWIK